MCLDEAKGLVKPITGGFHWACHITFKQSTARYQASHACHGRQISRPAAVLEDGWKMERDFVSEKFVKNQRLPNDTSSICQVWKDYMVGIVTFNCPSRTETIQSKSKLCRHLKTEIHALHEESLTRVRPKTLQQPLNSNIVVHSAAVGVGDTQHYACPVAVCPVAGFWDTMLLQGRSQQLREGCLEMSERKDQSGSDQDFHEFSSFPIS